MKGISAIIKELSTEPDNYPLNFYKAAYGVADFTSSEQLWMIKSGYDNLRGMIEIEHLMDEIRKLSLKKLNSASPKNLCERYACLYVYSRRIFSYQAEYPDATFSPSLNVLIYSIENFSYRRLLLIRKIIHCIKSVKQCPFKETGQKFYLNDSFFDTKGLIEESLLEIFKLFIKYLKFNQSSKMFKQQIRFRQQASHKTATNIENLLTHLFSTYSALTVNSLDTYMMSSKNEILSENFILNEALSKHISHKYGIDQFKLTKQTVDSYKGKDIKKYRFQQKIKFLLATFYCRERFLEAIQTHFKKRLKAFIWKLEYDNSTGFYIRWFFFLIPDSSLSDKKIASCMGEIWTQEIAAGGLYQNNHRSIMQNGLGIIHSHDHTKLSILRSNLRLIVHSDYFVDHKFYGRATIGMSQCSKAGPKCLK